MKLYNHVQLTLRDKNNRTLTGTLVLGEFPNLPVKTTTEDYVTNNLTRPLNSWVGHEEDPHGASSFVVAVILVYALSIIFLIASHVIVKNRESDVHDQDRQINHFLEKAPELKERSYRESYKKLKTSFIPVIAATPAKDLVSRRKSFAPFLLQASLQGLSVAAGGGCLDNDKQKGGLTPEGAEAKPSSTPSPLKSPSLMPTILEDDIARQSLSSLNQDSEADGEEASARYLDIPELPSSPLSWTDSSAVNSPSINSSSLSSSINNSPSVHRTQYANTLSVGSRDPPYSPLTSNGYPSTTPSLNEYDCSSSGAAAYPEDKLNGIRCSDSLKTNQLVVHSGAGGDCKPVSLRTAAFLLQRGGQQVADVCDIRRESKSSKRNAPYVDRPMVIRGLQLNDQKRGDRDPPRPGRAVSHKDQPPQRDRAKAAVIAMAQAVASGASTDTRHPTVTVLNRPSLPARRHSALTPLVRFTSVEDEPDSETSEDLLQVTCL